jgi:hypothetical protein
MAHFFLTLDMALPSVWWNVKLRRSPYSSLCCLVNVYKVVYTRRCYLISSLFEQFVSMHCQFWTFCILSLNHVSNFELKNICKVNGGDNYITSPIFKVNSHDCKIFYFPPGSEEVIGLMLAMHCKYNKVIVSFSLLFSLLKHSLMELGFYYVFEVI